MPTPRIDEIGDRLAEMELALPGLAERGPDALRYLARELSELVGESASWSARWNQTWQRSRALMLEIEILQRGTPQGHTED